jgi:CRP/FNR family transcriptional regulator
MSEARHDCAMCGLHRVCFPAHVASGSDRNANAVRIHRTRVAYGNALYRAGDRIESLYMVRSGCIKELDGADTAHDSIANFCLPGELLTLQSAGPAYSRTTCLAVQASFICAVPWRIVEEACAAAPDVASELINLIVKSGVATRELLTMIRSKEALQRVAGFCLNMCARVQWRGHPAGEFRLGMSREEIAQYLGLRSETVSRCFSELARRGLISVRARRVQVLAPAELRTVSLGEGP